MAWKLISFCSPMCLLLFAGLFSAATAGEKSIAVVELKEQHGFDRPLEYVEILVQLPVSEPDAGQPVFAAVREKNGQYIQCQVVEQKEYADQKIMQLRLLFPVSIKANHSETYFIKKTASPEQVESDLAVSGKGVELVIDNQFYRADLTKSDESEGKSHESGQLRELLLKLGYDVLLRRSGNRMHWAPNFQNADFQYYKTISAWDNPEKYDFIKGPYLIRTIRSDKAPEHPQILLTATYSFYDGLPWFRFYSSIYVEKDLTLFLLRNDEMTMDSLFTHIAYEKNPGEIVDLPFTERYQILESQPISNTARWLCFYNADKGYAFGSIRINYDITNKHGLPSPTYMPHTKISDGAGGGKYWNRRLVHEYPLFVPAGSRYAEENVYIVFKTGPELKFEEISSWTDRLYHPLTVTVRLEQGQ